MIESERDKLFAAARQTLMTALPDVWAIYVYGSFARGDESINSDIDLAVLLPPGRRLVNKLELTGKLSRELRRTVDLVDLRDAGLDLLREVLRDGRVLLVRNEEQTLAWEAERMTDYADFQPRRADILDAYLRAPLQERP